MGLGCTLLFVAWYGFIPPERRSDPLYRAKWTPMYKKRVLFRRGGYALWNVGMLFIIAGTIAQLLRLVN
jgi:hypothetical protein